MSEEQITEILVAIAAKNNYNLNNQLANAADFFMRAQVKKITTAVATVENAEGVISAIPYFKVKLFGSYDKRIDEPPYRIAKPPETPGSGFIETLEAGPTLKTGEVVKARKTCVVSKKDVLLSQILRFCAVKYIDATFVTAKATLYPLIVARTEELDREVAAKIAEYKKDEKRIAATRLQVEKVEASINEKHRDKLRQQLRVLVLSGWKKDDVLTVFEEEQCREVQES
jgi:hypothetical protein